MDFSKIPYPVPAIVKQFLEHNSYDGLYYNGYADDIMNCFCCLPNINPNLCIKDGCRPGYKIGIQCYDKSIEWEIGEEDIFLDDRLPNAKEAKKKTTEVFFPKATLMTNERKNRKNCTNTF